MGQVTLPPSGLIYVDTNALIYRVERIEPYLTASAPLWDALDAGHCQVGTSELTLFEVLVKPLRDGNHALAALYRNVLHGTSGLSCLPINVPLLEAAAQLRARHGLTTPDAIHAATALLASCTLFVTNDPTFRSVPGLQVAVLGEIATQA
ncbi:MAG: type II toxin-antitoxin system VapC family toxin [Gemmataceae bacterium]|nr:type II toxin-antitoxin system VapC family toxin [Gemmataceae bacterium]